MTLAKPYKSCGCGIGVTRSWNIFSLPSRYGMLYLPPQRFSSHDIPDLSDNIQDLSYRASALEISHRNQRRD
jgi:hypothetical protein